MDSHRIDISHTFENNGRWGKYKPTKEQYYIYSKFFMLLENKKSLNNSFKIAAF